MICFLWCLRFCVFRFKFLKVGALLKLGALSGFKGV